MRVKADYYDNLQRITDKFGGTELIPVKRAAEYLGCNAETLKRDKSFPIKKLGRMYYVTAVALARWMS